MARTNKAPGPACRVEHHPELAAFLERNGFHQAWRESVPGPVVTWAEGWHGRLGACVVYLYVGRGWDLFTAHPDTNIRDSIADAVRRFPGAR